MNQTQAAELTKLIKTYAETYGAVDRASGSNSRNEVEAENDFQLARMELANKINELTED